MSAQASRISELENKRGEKEHSESCNAGLSDDL